MVDETEELEVLEEDVQRLHNDLESGNLGDFRDIPDVINEISSIMDDESDLLKQKISEEIEKIEEAREKLKSDIESERKELNLASTVEEEWQKVIQWKEEQEERGKVVVSERRDNPVPMLKEIKKRLEEILKLEREELEDVFGGSSATGIKGFIENDLKESMRTHQKVALFREALVQVSKETYKVDKGDYGVDFELATELGTSDFQEIQQAWVYNEKHTEKVENNILPLILEREKELIEEVEDVLEEIEKMIELDRELLEKISGESSEGRLLGIGSGDLYDLLNNGNEFRPDGTNVSESDDVEPILPETLKQLNEISDIVEELKKESVGEGKQLDTLLEETNEYVSTQKSKVKTELNRVQDLDTSDAELGDVPVGDYAPQVRQKGEELADHIRKLKSAYEGNYWDKDLQAELEDLKRRAEKLHEVEHREVDDVREFEERVNRVRLMLEGDTESGDDVEGVVTAFRKYKSNKTDIDTVIDLPTYDDIYHSFPGRDIRELPEHIRMAVQSGEKTLDDLSPANFMTQENLLDGEESQENLSEGEARSTYGLRDIFNPNTGEGAIQQLKKDIKRIYSEEETVGDTFSSIEDELKDLDTKFNQVNRVYHDYEMFMQELSNTSIQLQGQERNNITALVEEVAALMIYDKEYDSGRRMRERLRQDLDEISNWIENRMPRLIQDIENIIYGEDGSIVNEEHVEEEKMEEAIKELTESISVLEEEFDDRSPSSGSTEEVQNIVDGILRSLREIASRCTDFKDKEEKNIPELKEWANVLEGDFEGFRERAEEHSEYTDHDDGYVPDNQPRDDIDHEE